MWNRADLKANAKKIFFGNYWKAVLVTLILTIILGGATNTITEEFQIISQQIGQLIRIFPVFQVMMNGQMMKY